MDLFFQPDKDVIYNVSAFDTQGRPNTSGFNTLFKDPTTLANELRITVRPFSLTSHQLVGVMWGNKPFTALNQDPRTTIADGTDQRHQGVHCVARRSRD